MPSPVNAGVRIISMTFILLGLGVAGFAALIAYVAFCERI